MHLSNGQLQSTRKMSQREPFRIDNWNESGNGDFLEVRSLRTASQLQHGHGSRSGVD